MKITAGSREKNTACKLMLWVVIGIVSLSTSAEAVIEGYYCDLFIDGGVSISDRDHLAAADYLGLSQEFRIKCAGV